MLTVGRYFEMPLPTTLDNFLVQIPDIIDIAGNEVCVLEAVAQTLLFLKIKPEVLVFASNGVKISMN